jgi:hypothetical protein
VHYMEYNATEKTVRIIPMNDHYRPLYACPVVSGLDSAEAIADALGVTLYIIS